MRYLLVKALMACFSILCRANFLQKCKLPGFVDVWACNPDNLESYKVSLMKSNNMAHTVHQSLYLGEDGLHPFADKRLMVSHRCSSCTIPKYDKNACCNYGLTPDSLNSSYLAASLKTWSRVFSPEQVSGEHVVDVRAHMWSGDTCGPLLKDLMHKLYCFVELLDL